MSTSNRPNLITVLTPTYFALQNKPLETIKQEFENTGFPLIELTSSFNKIPYLIDIVTSGTTASIAKQKLEEECATLKFQTLCDVLQKHISTGVFNISSKYNEKMDSISDCALTIHTETPIPFLDLAYELKNAKLKAHPLNYQAYFNELIGSKLKKLGNTYEIQNNPNDIHKDDIFNLASEKMTINRLATMCYESSKNKSEMVRTLSLKDASLKQKIYSFLGL